MPKIELARVKGDFGFEAKDEQGHVVKMDSSPESGGRGIDRERENSRKTFAAPGQDQPGQKFRLHLAGSEKPNRSAKRGVTSGAIEQFEQALRVSPNDEITKRNLAKARAMLEKR